MSVYATIGMFWVILSTASFTAFMLITAIWSITLGIKVALARYKMGESLERALAEPVSKETQR